MKIDIIIETTNVSKDTMIVNHNSNTGKGARGHVIEVLSGTLSKHAESLDMISDKGYDISVHFMIYTVLILQ